MYWKLFQSWEGCGVDRNVNYMTAYNEKLNLSQAKMLNINEIFGKGNAFWISQLTPWKNPISLHSVTEVMSEFAYVLILVHDVHSKMVLWY